MKPFTLAILGGDRRLIYTANRFFEEGFRIQCFGLPDVPLQAFKCHTLEKALSGADAVLLPVPMSRDQKTLFAPALKEPLLIKDLFRSIPSTLPIFAGSTSSFQDSRLIDYAARPDFASMGAIPTAEGALLLAIEHLPCTVNQMPVGIVGFGKVGKAAASLFRAAGASVTVFARRDEVCTVASQLGYSAASIAELPEYAGDFRCLINTVPALVIDDHVLCRMKQYALILELASAPYGVDFKIAEQLGIKVVLAGGLPGKYSPESSGEAVFQVVYHLLKEFTDTL